MSQGGEAAAERCGRGLPRLGNLRGATVASARLAAPFATLALWGCTNLLHLAPTDLPREGRRGDPVTVYPRGREPVRGTLMAVRGDSVTVRRDVGVLDTVAVPRYEIRRMIELWWGFKVREVEADDVLMGTKVQVEPRKGRWLVGVVARVTPDDLFLITEGHEAVFAVAALDSARVTRLDMTNAMGITAAGVIGALFVRAATANRPTFWVDR